MKLKKGAIYQVQLTQGEFLKNIFLVLKKDRGNQPVVNLKHLFEQLHTLLTIEKRRRTFHLLKEFVTPFWLLNPFFPNASFLYLTVFWFFQDIEKGCIWNEWVNASSKCLSLSTTNKQMKRFIPENYYSQIHSNWKEKKQRKRRRKCIS